MNEVERVCYLEMRREDHCLYMIRVYRRHTPLWVRALKGTRAESCLASKQVDCAFGF